LKKLENILQVFNITEEEACRIICKHAYEGKAGRKFSIFKLELSRQVKIILEKKKGRSLNEAINIFHRTYFEKFRKEWNAQGKEIVKKLTKERIRGIIYELQNTQFKKGGIADLLDPSRYIIPKKVVRK